MLLAAAHVEATTCACDAASRTGGSSASPITYMAPPMALATISVEWQCR